MQRQQLQDANAQMNEQLQSSQAQYKDALHRLTDDQNRAKQEAHALRLEKVFICDGSDFTHTGCIEL